METLINFLAEKSAAEFETKQETEEILGFEIKASDKLTFSIWGKLHVERTNPPIGSDEYVSYERGFYLYNVYLDVDEQSFYTLSKEEEYQLEDEINKLLK